MPAVHLWRCTVDLFSVDVYACSAQNPKQVDADEALYARDFYRKYIYSKLHPHQRLMVVPGLFADPDAARSGSLEAQVSTVHCRHVNRESFKT